MSWPDEWRKSLGWAGPYSVEWEGISELTSKTTFQVELKSGNFHYGSLVTPPHGESLQVAEMSGNISQLWPRQLERRVIDRASARAHDGSRARH
jgi:hypothetical protein